MPIKPNPERIAKKITIILNGFSIFYFSSYFLAKIIPKVATIAEKVIPKTKVVKCGISHLIMVPSTKLPKANFAISIKNLPKS